MKPGGRSVDPQSNWEIGASGDGGGKTLPWSTARQKKNKVSLVWCNLEMDFGKSHPNHLSQAGGSGGKTKNNKDIKE